MKVLHVGKYYAPHRGGIETALRLLCEGLRPRVDVEVLAAGETRGATRDVVSGVPVLRCGTWLTIASAPICPGMVQAIKATRADLIHLHLPNPPALLAYLAGGSRTPLVATYHSDTIRQKFLGAAFSPFLRMGLDRCAAIIAASRNYLDSSPVLSAYRDRCRIIPYGIPLEPYENCDALAAARIRRRYGPRIVLGAGRLVYYKGFEYLIDAMKEIRGRLLIIGEGPLRASLERRVHHAGIDDRVDFLGEVEDMVPYYHAADVFALASTERSEAFGIVQLEAMACGKPVVNTRIPSGAPFVSEDGRTGLTVPPCDAGALARAINGLLDEPALREKYGAAGRRRVAELFSLRKMVHETIRIYNEVLERSPA